jgi:hypothetical protein
MSRFVAETSIINGHLELNNLPFANNVHVKACAGEEVMVRDGARVLLSSFQGDALGYKHIAPLGLKILSRTHVN